MLMMYGYAPETLDDPVLHMAEEAAKLVGHLVALGGTLINVMPILGHIPSWVPGATAKRMAERARFLTEEAKRIPLEHVKTALVSTVTSCLYFDTNMKPVARRHSAPVPCEQFLREEGYGGSLA